MLRPEVLRSKKDFTDIYNKGKSLGDRYVVVFHRENHLDYTRTAFLASKTKLCSIEILPKVFYVCHVGDSPISKNLYV